MIKILERILELATSFFRKIGVRKEVKQKLELKFNNEQFKIIQFTDLHQHFGESEENRNTTKLMEEILDSEKPDLVVITGDCVDGRYCNGEEEVKSAIDNIAKPMEDRKIPWAVVLGNHDSEKCGVSRERQMEIYTSYKYNLSNKYSTVSGKSGDYNLLINDSGNTVPIFNLYMLDSGDYSSFGYGYLESSQIDWYKIKSNELKNKYKKIIPSLMFFHIPLQQQISVWESGKAIGERGEKECVQGKETGMFKALTEIKDVIGVFVGHDHTNDYYGNIDNIILAYGRKTGYNCYDRAGFLKGVRVIALNESNLEKFDTYEKLEK